jgi:hypothetical protein
MSKGQRIVEEGSTLPGLNFRSLVALGGAREGLGPVALPNCDQPLVRGRVTSQDGPTQPVPSVTAPSACHRGGDGVGVRALSCGGCRGAVVWCSVSTNTSCTPTSWLQLCRGWRGHDAPAGDARARATGTGQVGSRSVVPTTKREPTSVQCGPWRRTRGWSPFGTRRRTPRSSLPPRLKRRRGPRAARSSEPSCAAPLG